MRALSFDRSVLSFGGVGLADWRGCLPTALELVMVLLLALQAARLLWMALTPLGPIGAPAALADLPATAARLPTTDVFYKRMTAASPADGSSEALGYTLFGLRSESGDGGSAILGKNDEQASYAVGREIAPGIVLETVGVDHAVLASNGARHRIELPRFADTAAPRTAGTLPVGATKPATAEPPTVDPQDLLAEAGLRANDDGGYTLIPRGDGALLRQVGLQSGDVLTSVNGRPLDPERLGDLKNELKGQSQVTIQYQRDGQAHTTTLKAPQ